MEDSFRVRVDKAFGSLLTSPPSSDSRGKEALSLPLSSLWCLTDDEIPRKEWNRDCPGDHDLSDSIPYPPNLDGFVFANNSHTYNNANTAQTDVPSSSQHGTSSSDLHQEFETDLRDIVDLCEDYGDDEDKEPNSKRKRQRGNPNDYDESNIRSSIGLDCTLDFEEEEDEYDKVAVGREKATNHLCKRNATEYGIDVNTYNDLPDTVQDFARDPRADHAAAKLRLKEDAEAAGNFDLLRLSDAPETLSFLLEDGSSRKSIIKKRGQTDTKTQKRVRFNNNSSDSSLIATKENCSIKGAKASEEDSNMIRDTSVPDYIRNPLNYTHYTFDAATDMDDDSNRKAYLEFLSLVRKPDTTQVQQEQGNMADHPPKSLTFNRKKTNLDIHADQVGNKHPNVQLGKCSRVGIALSDDTPEDEISAMEEDDQGIAVDTTNSTLKFSRQYRTRTKRDFDDQE